MSIFTTSAPSPAVPASIGSAAASAVGVTKEYGVGDARVLALDDVKRIREERRQDNADAESAPQNAQELTPDARSGA